MQHVSSTEMLEIFSKSIALVGKILLWNEISHTILLFIMT